MTREINDLKNIVAIVGITATNISFGIIARLLQQGAIVVVPAQSLHHLQLLQNYLGNANNPNLITILTDLPDYDKAVALVETVIESYGPLEIVVFPFDHTSGNADLSNISIEQWQRAVEENLSVYFICCRVILNAMKKRGEGFFVAVIDSDGRPTSNNAMANMLMSGQAKMAYSFFDELENSRIKFYHLFLQAADKALTDANENKHISPEAIAEHVLSLFHGDYVLRDTPFIYLKEESHQVEISG